MRLGRNRPSNKTCETSPLFRTRDDESRPLLRTRNILKFLGVRSVNITNSGLVVGTKLVCHQPRCGATCSTSMGETWTHPSYPVLFCLQHYDRHNHTLVSPTSSPHLICSCLYASLAAWNVEAPNGSPCRTFRIPPCNDLNPPQDLGTLLMGFPKMDQHNFPQML